MKFCRYSYITLVFVLLILLSSCTISPLSSLTIKSSNEQFKLFACNNSALTNLIEPEKNGNYSYFSFSKEFYDNLLNRSQDNILSIQIKLHRCNKEQNGNFAFGYLYNEDFNKNKLLQKLNARKMVYSHFSDKNDNQSIQSDLLVISFMINPSELDKLKGLVFYSEVSIEIVEVELIESNLGWSFTNDIPWFGFSYEGGVVNQNIKQNKFDIESCKLLNSAIVYLTVSNLLPKYELMSDKDVSNKIEKNRIEFEIDNSEFILYPYKEEREVQINLLQFESCPKEIVFTENVELVKSFVLKQISNSEKNEIAKPLYKIVPIKTDPGLIRNWSQKNWRNSEFEIFSWENFPSVLIFDFKNYFIQDEFLKRLAFFTEKKGFVGQLMSDEEMSEYHGYNAHDYKSESLASFFDKANKENFKLNEKELLLRQILLEQGIIKIQSGNIVSGEGAIISLSRESAAYLRSTFLCHEGLHGIYFTNPNFRSFVSYVYNTSDTKSIEFMKAYFSVTPSLNYDIEDSYLMENEFMAYLLQQGLSFTVNYFAMNLANRKYINQENPELANYIKNTNALGLEEAAQKLDKFIYENYGMNAGREWLVLRNTKS